MNRAIAILSGVGAAVAAAYFLDPRKGADRRAVVRDKALSLRDDAMKVINEKTNELRQQANGVTDEAKGLIADGQSAGKSKPAMAA
jgi:hypothetical protein